MRCLVLGLLVIAPSLRAAAEAERQTPKMRFETLLKEYEGASPDGARSKSQLLRDYAARFLELAEECPEDPAAADALLVVVEMGVGAIDNHESRATLIGKAMDLLVRHHLRDENLGRICLELVHYPSPLHDRFLRSVFEMTPDRAVRARACLSLAQYLSNKAELARTIQRPLTAGEQHRAKAMFGGSIPEKW